ncbi:DUF2380 domain-containing protein [Candidatus Thiodictyon syntrophicum]|jgi:hypothetical protein|uniref:DUF2380 domain-containing protein n=1 Tax=Candidatus Thiodictyon syntrophicum TaxID=1166950 RepID=A0A2K8UJD3_9GAMM|nr:DUF2380 domain-containing protein [Candidatus Thiodictyon syntrophicum]AUB85684.1 hypothetical protein THSYN_32870 [Candidatus Thiodictyon syntrophicum]
MRTRKPRGDRTTALALICTALWFLWVAPADADPAPAAKAAAPAIAVLDFELNDLTLLPGTPEELARTASLRPLVEQGLKAQGSDQLVSIDAAALAQANVGVGYLYDHPEAAAALGRTQGADLVLVGRLHKPSFLFAYLMARLVDSRTGMVVRDLVVEAKGQTGPATARAAARLAEQVRETLARH